MKGAPRPSRARGGKPKHERGTSRPEPPADRPEPGAEIHGRLLEIALDGARGQARRLHAQERALRIVGLAGMVLIGLRGVVAAVASARPTAPLVSASLGAGVVVSTAALLWAWRLRGRLEHLLRDVQTLDHARESLDEDAAPRVEVGPVQAEDGSERPVVVVRNDSMERLLRKGAPPEARARSLDGAAWGAVAIIALAITGTLFIDPGSSSARRWTFVDPSEPAALGFRVVGDRSGSWLVEQHSTATGAHALTNRAGDRDSPPASLIAHGIQGDDLRATTRCKVAAESDGAACGIVFRFHDGANHHVARLDFERRRLVVASVSDGIEHELAAAAVRIEAGTWQELAVEVRGDRIRVSCNDRDPIETSSARSMAPPGHVGLWVPATGEAYFDELTIDVLPPASSTLAVVPILRKSS